MRRNRNRKQVVPDQELALVTSVRERDSVCVDYAGVRVLCGTRECVPVRDWFTEPEALLPPLCSGAFPSFDPTLNQCTSPTCSHDHLLSTNCLSNAYSLVYDSCIDAFVEPSHRSKTKKEVYHTQSYAYDGYLHKRDTGQVDIEQKNVANR